MAGNEIRSITNTWLHTPYAYGGGSTNGIDCSHFVWEVLKAAGHPNAQYMTAERIAQSPHVFSRVRPDEVQEGDVVHFSGSPQHVGIVVDPKAGIFVGAQSSRGVSPASYVHGYWAGRHPTFYRYSGH